MQMTRSVCWRSKRISVSRMPVKSGALPRETASADAVCVAKSV